MTPLAFDLAGITKTHALDNNPVHVLKGINLQITAGQYVAIIGPSGSGKSTLMQLLGLLDLPTRGVLSVFGQNTGLLSDDQLSAFRRRAIGFIFQAFHLLPSYDALANVALAMAYSGRNDRWARATSLLQNLGLKHRLHHKPRALSGGEQQRVAIARSVANDPKIILADEPTGALDQENGRAVLELLDAFHGRGKTIVLVTHDPHVAVRAGRIVEIVDGKILSDHLNTPRGKV
jgi:ABC-type lipoprotein export system ATPase subunit